MPTRLDPIGRPASSASQPSAPDPVTIPPADRAALLRLAGATLAAVTGQRPMASLDDALLETARLDEPAAVFVTLTEDGQLRGCMGGLVAERPINEAVVVAARMAALHDPRFAPVSVPELPAVRIEISALGPPVPLRAPSDLRPGIDGVIVERGPAVALLLPEVADHFGWGGREMVEAACRKAGLATDAWRDGRTRMFVFRTAHFGEPPAPGRDEIQPRAL
jgi:AmmeMemoRadiSam system protein A